MECLNPLFFIVQLNLTDKSGVKLGYLTLGRLQLSSELLDFTLNLRWNASILSVSQLFILQINDYVRDFVALNKLWSICKSSLKAHKLSI